MTDPRQDYGDPPPAWAAAGAADPTGLRPCDRAHLAGWVGVFVALIIAGIGIGYGGVLRGGPTGGQLLVLGLVAAAVGGYGFAGVYLILHTLTDRPPTGPLVLLCNVIVVGPILVPGTAVVLGMAPAAVVVTLATCDGTPAFSCWLMTAAFGAMTAIQGVILWRDGRKLVRVLRAWLDPTLGQWW